MKIQIVISAVILGIAAFLGGQIDRWHTTARTEERKLVAQARRLGIPENEGHSARTTKVKRVDHQAEAKQLALEYITQAKQWMPGAVLDEAAKKRWTDTYRRISDLEPTQSRTFTMDVLASMDLREKIQVACAVGLLRELAKKDPPGALGFLIKNSAALKVDIGAEYIVSDALGRWAKDDPLAAMDWIRKYSGEFPEALSAQSRGDVFRGASEKDPRVAFSLISGLGLNASDAHSAMNDIVTAATTDEEMTATLAALREYREANHSNKELTRVADQNLGNFAQALRRQTFESASKWVESAKLNPRELDSFCNDLGTGIVEEPAKWIEWMGHAFSPGKGDGSIMNLVETWTEQDYEAAGKWLGSAPESPAKTAAIRGYAQTIFKHEPETAMQWIVTLPPGKDRDSTLKTIHMNWPEEDKAGAAAFAAEHGIK